jgi:hypothetical protein
VHVERNARRAEKVQASRESSPTQPIAVVRSRSHASAKSAGFDRVEGLLGPVEAPARSAAHLPSAIVQAVTRRRPRTRHPTIDCRSTKNGRSYLTRYVKYCILVVNSGVSTAPLQILGNLPWLCELSAPLPTSPSICARFCNNSLPSDLPRSTESLAATRVTTGTLHSRTIVFSADPPISAQTHATSITSSSTGRNPQPLPIDW